LSRFLVTALREPGPRWHLFLRHDVPQEDGTRVRALRSLSRYRDRVCCWPGWRLGSCRSRCPCTRFRSRHAAGGGCCGWATWETPGGRRGTPGCPR
jgi:hypothetical protein